MRILWVLTGASLCLQATVQLPALISDHMVLQQEVPVRLWGRAAPGEPIQIAFAGQHLSTKADPSGRWQAWLMPLKAGGPFQLQVRGENELRVRDVLVGEVWVASGQSNMVWPVKQSKDAEKEIPDARYRQIRLFQVQRKVAAQPEEEVVGEWKVCSPETVGDFSAVAYFFARDIHRRKMLPVGILQSAVGGTPAQAWTRREALEQDPLLKTYLDRWPEVKAKHEANKTPRPTHEPAVLWNGMIAPLTPYTIRGVLWYQGETNGSLADAFLYRRLFSTMITDWRDQWRQGIFPFYFVQLANYDAGAGADWPTLRESQTRALHLRDTAMAVTIDVGESKDIHPKDKQSVGERLARIARALSYGEQVEFSGPLYRSVTVEGNRLRVWFDHAKGLAARSGQPTGFLISGADKKFRSAQAQIEGNTVVVSAPGVDDPVAVRYCWANDPVCNLINGEGLPASPFRTDQWADAQLVPVLPSAN